MGYPNGQIPASALRGTVVGGSLRDDASKSMDRMALQYATDFGRSLVATDTYRSLAAQWTLWNGPKRVLAAYPGTSNHGWGLAVDLSSGFPSWTSDSQLWFKAKGGLFGWVSPGWATPGHKEFQKSEPWHKEFHPDLDRSGKGLINRPGDGEWGLGSAGPKIERLQRFLNEYYKGSKVPAIVPDGGYGMATYALVRRWQKVNGYTYGPGAGVVGPWTFRELREHGFTAGP